MIELIFVGLILFGLGVVGILLRVLVLADQVDDLTNKLIEHNKWVRAHQSLHSHRDTYKDWPNSMK